MAVTQGMDTEEALRVVSQHYKKRKVLLQLNFSFCITIPNTCFQALIYLLHLQLFLVLSLYSNTVSAI